MIFGAWCEHCDGHSTRTRSPYPSSLVIRKVAVYPFMTLLIFLCLVVCSCLVRFLSLSPDQQLSPTFRSEGYMQYFDKKNAQCCQSDLHSSSTRKSFSKIFGVHPNSTKFGYFVQEKLVICLLISWKKLLPAF